MRNIMTLLLSFIISISSFAQESSNASGGDATGAGGTVAYSVGQIVYTTNTGTSGSVAQGVQHAYEIYTVSTNELFKDVSLEAFPNPVSDYLTVNLTDELNSQLSYAIMDINGKVIISKEIESSTSIIDITKLSVGSYFLRIITSENEIVKEFKIVKK